jgi:hypothetical protein
MTPRWPTFFIVGAPKTGTTSLYHYLNQHPAIYMSPVKEPCYFASEVRMNRLSHEFRSTAAKRDMQLREYLQGAMSGPDPGGIIEDWEDYLALFKSVEAETAIGEASVCYLWSPTAAANIRSRIPDAKILMILRDPAERAFSQYLHYAADGLVRRSFREQIERCARHTQHEFNTLYPFLEYGRYYQQVKAYLDRFPHANVKICFYEEAWRDSQCFLRTVFEYLNVDPEFRPDVSKRSLQGRAPKFLASYYWSRKSEIAPRLKALIPKTMREGLRGAVFRSGGALGSAPKMDASDRSYLCDFYRDDVGKLSALLDRDLSAWLK